MKRGESTNTIAMIILLASFALRLSLAMPLLNPVGENTTNGGNNLSISLPEIITSNYTSTVFANREAWRANNCEGNFNCAPVSPMQCGSTSVIYFSPTEGTYLICHTYFVTQSIEQNLLYDQLQISYIVRQL